MKLYDRMLLLKRAVIVACNPDTESVQIVYTDKNKSITSNHIASDVDHMKKLSLSNDTQRMAEILMDYSEIFFACENIDTKDQYDMIKYDTKINDTFYQILSTGQCNMYLIELMNVMGISIDQFDNKKIIELIKQKTNKTKIIKCLQLVIVEYICLFFLPHNNNKNDHNNKFIKNVLNMISWLLCTPNAINTTNDDNDKHNKQIINIIGSIVRKKLLFNNDNLITCIIDFFLWFENALGACLNVNDNHVLFVTTIVNYLTNICCVLNTMNVDFNQQIKQLLVDKSTSNDQKNTKIHELMGIEKIDLGQILGSLIINNFISNNEIKILKLIESLV